MNKIDRREFLKNSSLLVAGLSIYGCFGNIKTEKPNFVFILVDDLGWKDLGCYGSSFYETPNIDKLAETGIKFTNAYAASPVCSPTRAAIMTGKHPARLNITDWIPGDDPKDRKLLGPQDLNELPLEEITIAEVLKKNNYKTFFAGKWHLGDEGYYPEDQGFDINIGGHHRGSPPGGYYSPYKNPKLPDGPEGEYLTDRLTDESIKFLQENKNDPFILFLSFYTVHTPIQASKKHIAKFQEKLKTISHSKDDEQVKEHDGFTKQYQDNPEYASMVYAMDENVGRLLDKINELKLDENTVVIFTSDNGGLSTLYKKGYPTSNVPLRAGKGWCYEGGIKVPFIMRVPGISGENIQNNTSVISSDFFPTMLELAGIEQMPKQHKDGLSLVPLLHDNVKTLDREAIFWHFPHYHGSAWKPGSAVRAGDWKLIEFYDEEKVELYNLANDIEERNNLAEDMPEKTNELREMLKKWLVETDAKMPSANPNYVLDDNL